MLQGFMEQGSHPHCFFWMPENFLGLGRCWWLEASGHIRPWEVTGWWPQPWVLREELGTGT